MDLEPALKQPIIRVRDSLHGFAKWKGWAKDDYRIFMIVNVVWFNIIVELVAKEYDSIFGDMKAQYDEVLDHLEKDLEHEIGLYESIGLILAPFLGYPFGASPQYGENVVPVDHGLLNPGAEELRSIGQGSMQG